MDDIFKQIDKLNLELPNKKRGCCSEDNEIEELKKHMFTEEYNKEQKEFCDWAEKHTFDVEKMYLEKNFKLQIAEYIAFLTEFYPELIRTPDAAMKIAFGAFVYGYYAGKVKKYEV